jgi:hypothetical protein
MRTRSLLVSSLLGVALLGLAGSANAAGKITTVSKSITVKQQTNGTVTVSCSTPSGYVAPLAVGGGFQAALPLEVYRSRAVTASKTYTINGKKVTKTVAIGWEVAARNHSYSASATLGVSVQCLTGAPSPKTTYVQQVATANTTVVNGQSLGWTPACSTGVAVAGGFTGDVSSNTDPAAVRVYINELLVDGNQHYIQVDNETGGSKKVTAYAYCLNGWSGASAWVGAQALSVEGITQPACISGTIAAGGGWQIPQYLDGDVGPNPTVIQVTRLTNTSVAVDMDPGAPDIYPPPDPTSWGLVNCVKAP